MRGVWLLSMRHALHNRAQTVILTLCLSVTMLLPLATRTLVGHYRADLESRAQSTPLVFGARGNRFDLTLVALYFRRSSLKPITMEAYRSIASQGRGIAVPIHTRYTARDIPIVATTPEYFELRGLRALEGTLPLQIGEVAIGSRVARQLELGVGDALFSDQKDLYDISKPPALKMRICGVLAPSAPGAVSPDDSAVFVDINTAWILEGLSHGHDEASTIDPSLLLSGTEDHVAISPALIEYNEVTEGNVASFHVHGDASLLPLSAVLLFPVDDKDGTILKTGVNNRDPLHQIVEPASVIEDLMSFVFRIKALFDALALVLGGSMALMMVLVVLLSLRVRKREMETLNRIGCARFTVVKLYAAELGLIIASSGAIALLGTAVASQLLPNLVRVL